MRHDEADLDSIILQATNGRLDPEVVEAFCQAQGVDFERFCNMIALKIARDFDSSVMPFEDADAVMNAVSGLMTTHAAHVKDAMLPEPAWSVFLAFDAGEYSREADVDPVERYTKRLIRRLLAGAA